MKPRHSYKALTIIWAVSLIASVQVSGGQVAFQLRLEAPINTWDEAIPLGNGLLGGLLWERLGIELLFTCAAGFGLGALVFSCLLPRPVNR